MKARLTKDFRFESAQKLPKLPKGHRCRELHGHSFKVEVSIEGEVDPLVGWIYDHARISEVMEPIIEKLDHSFLNDIPGLENPTIENMAAWLWAHLAPKLPGLAEIVLHETPKSRVSYRGQ
ncbi:MAG: 6-carboxytetrahydropterin synthase QueD [Verrucomicrobia bacterium]|nr:MAG: 6-carboxytetrahydropterin synthase QueD [Verrucomicrobiota bacterium]